MLNLLCLSVTGDTVWDLQIGVKIKALGSNLMPPAASSRSRAGCAERREGREAGTATSASLRGGSLSAGLTAYTRRPVPTPTSSSAEEQPRREPDWHQRSSFNSEDTERDLDPPSWAHWSGQFLLLQMNVVKLIKHRLIAIIRHLRSSRILIL